MLKAELDESEVIDNDSQWCPNTVCCSLARYIFILKSFSILLVFT